MILIVGLSNVSVIVVGRNDDHGYNLQKRVSTSLNSIASLLGNNDEIVFVDWNSPSEYPLMPVAIWDSLTDHCRSVLRIIGVSEAIHDQVKRLSSRKLLEPIARNVGIRRAKPSSNWILSTNTDIIFLPSNFEKLSDLCDTLDERLWMCSRNEIPEFLWESFDRKEVVATQDALSALHNHSRISQSIVWRPFSEYNFDICDGVGDFQLAPSRHWNQIKGFPENMLLGWHVDTRATIAFANQTGFEPKILNQKQMVMYHQNHLRTPTSYHTDLTMNPIDEAKLKYDNPSNWGLAELQLPELRLDTNYKKYVQQSSELICSLSGFESESFIDGSKFRESVTYSLPHIAPFLIEELHNSYLKGAIALISANKSTVDLVKNYTKLTDSQLELFESLEELFESELVNVFNCIILDLGLDEQYSNDEAVSQEIKLRSGRLALGIPLIASRIRSSQTKFIFLRTQNWATRNLVQLYFDVPLFNNYSGILSGRRKSETTKNKLKEYLYLGGVRFDYQITETPAMSRDFLLWFARRLPRKFRRTLLNLTKKLLRIKF